MQSNISVIITAYITLHSVCVIYAPLASVFSKSFRRGLHVVGG